MEDLFKQFLLEEYKQLNESLHTNEQRGEKRLEFFVTLSSITIGAIGFVFKDIGTLPDRELVNSFYLIVIFLLSGLTYIGWLTIKRLEKRDSVTDGFKKDIAGLRSIVLGLDAANTVFPANYSVFGRGVEKEKRKSGIYAMAKVITAVLVATLCTFVGLILLKNFEELSYYAVVAFAAAVFAAAIFLLFRSSAESPTHSGGVVVKTEDGVRKYLLTVSSKNPAEWVLPKGHIERAETTEFTAVREVMEETGILAKPLHILGTACYRKRPGGPEIRVLVYLMEFCGTYAGGEGRRIEWLTKTEAVERLFSEEMKVLMRRV